MSIVYTSAKEALQLGEEWGRGGEGIVYAILERPDQLAKLYSSAPHGGYEQKLIWMKNNSPDDPSRSQGHASLAWPLDLLYDEKGSFIGYTMPLIRDAAPILEVFNPYSRKTTYPEFTLKYLYRSARNLASAVAALHARDYIIGDLNERNILVTSSAMVTVIDTDSFQVREHRHERIVVYPCPVGKPEYMPPELQAWGLSNEVRRPEHDNFTLAVMIFQLLMEGSHPFRSRWLGQDDPPPIEKKIQLGYFPYDKTKQRWVAPPPNIPDLRVLPPALAAMFLRCFSEGLQDVRLRPSPIEWARTLAEAEDSLKRCHDGHEYPGHLKVCPHCSDNTTDTLSWLSNLRSFPGFLWSGLSAALSSLFRGIDGLFRTMGAGKRRKSYIFTAVGIIVLISLSVFLVSFWQHSVADRAFKIMTSVPIGYGMNKSSSSLPLVEEPKNSNNTTTQTSVIDKKNPEIDKNSKNQVKDAKDSVEKKNPEKDDKKETNKIDQEKKNAKDKELKNKEKEKVIPQQNPESANDKRNPGNEVSTIPAEHHNVVKSSSFFEVSTVSQIVLLKSLLKDPHCSVTALAFSPSGNSLVTGLSDYSVRVWRVKDGANTLLLKGHTRKVNAVAFSPDGTLIASGSGDLSIRIWRASDGELLGVLNGHQGSVMGLAFSHNGEYLATGSADNTIRIWRLKDGTEIQTLKGTPMDVTCVAFAPSDKVIVSGSQDNAIRFWQVEDGKLLSSINAHTGDVSCLKFSPSGGLLASSSLDYSIRFWSFRDYSLQRKLVGHLKAVNSISFSINGELLASGSDDGTVKIWRVSNGELLRTIQDNVTAVKCVAFSPEGTTLAAGLENGTINIWGISEK